MIRTLTNMVALTLMEMQILMLRLLIHIDFQQVTFYVLFTLG